MGTDYVQSTTDGVLMVADCLPHQVPLTVDGRERTLNAARFVSGGMCMLRPDRLARFVIHALGVPLLPLIATLIRPDRLARFVIHALGGGGWQEHACLKNEWSRALGTAFERLCIFSGDRRTSKCFDWDIKGVPIWLPLSASECHLSASECLLRLPLSAI
jgi:hypothetical protein